MKIKQKLVAGAAVLSALAGFSAPAAYADVAATVGAGNMYYWRGLDLGNGDASVWGDLKFSEKGFYTGIWGGSGDATNGTEYDIYAGYGSTLGDFKYDLSIWSYSYPSATTTELSADVDGVVTSIKGDASLKPGDLSEVVLMLGYGPVAFTYYKNIAAKYGDNSYSYATLAVTLEQFTLKYGQHMDDTDGVDGLAHVDLTYAYNDKVSFTIGKVTDNLDDSINDEAKFVVGFTLPIE